MVEAMYWKPLEGGRVACELCPQACKLSDGGIGICKGRVNRGGVLYAENYGRCVSVAMDPIEKKPLYHVCPGSNVLSVACNGCNLRCDFCQNWAISQATAQTTEIPPKELIRLATKHGSFGIAYTYTEPLVWFEYLVAAGSLAHKKGLKNMLVTNGIINEQPMKELIPLIDAMNIDLKSMNPEFYRTYCHIDGLDAVLRTITMAAKSCHVEVTNLVIPGLNDSEDETRALVEFIANLSPAIPLHFSRYFPSHKMKIPSTPIETLERAAEIAREKLYYVSLGNVGSRSDSDTRCPECGNVLVRRTGYSGEVVGISDRKCDRCGRLADFLWCD